MYSLPKIFGKRKILAFVDGTYVEVRARQNPAVWPMFSGVWYFEGEVAGSKTGTVISGTYRMYSLPRAIFLLFLYVIPFFLFVGLVGIGAAIAMAAMGIRPWSMVPEGLVFLLLPGGLLVFAWLLIRLMGWFERGSRARIREFLEQV